MTAKKFDRLLSIGYTVFFLALAALLVFGCDSPTAPSAPPPPVHRQAALALTAKSLFTGGVRLEIRETAGIGADVKAIRGTVYLEGEAPYSFAFYEAEMNKYGYSSGIPGGGVWQADIFRAYRVAGGVFTLDVIDNLGNQFRLNVNL